MLSRGYDYGFGGWDEPPMPRSEIVRRNDERLDRAIMRARENSPGVVMLELGLFVAAPFVVAAVVTLILNAAGISAGF